MAHHKRGKPKSSRAGCLLCKPHKHQRNRKTPSANIVRRLQDRIEDLVAGEDTVHHGNLLKYSLA